MSPWSRVPLPQNEMKQGVALGDKQFAGWGARRWFFLILSYAIAAGCLYWAFHGIRVRDLVHSMAGIGWWWVVLAVIFNLLIYFCAGWEWRILVRPLGQISFGRAFQAVFASRFANDILPVHAGYVVRIYLTSQAISGRVAPLISSLLIERILDVFWLVVGIGVTAFFFPLPHEVARAGLVLGAGLVVGLSMVAWLLLRKHKRPGVRPLASRLVIKLSSFIDRLAQGLRTTGRPRVLLGAFFLSVAKLVSFCLAFLLLLRAYGFSFSIWISLALFLIAYVGISLPSTPAGIGVFQLVCIAGLRFFGVSRPAASSFALLAYIVLTVPLTLAGFFAAAQGGLSLAQIGREVAGWKAPAE